MSDNSSAGEKKSSLSQLQAAYAADPTSQVFAALAEALREKGDLAAAETVAREGVKTHQRFAAGLVVYGRILKELKKFEEAEIYLKRATDLAPENILGHHSLAELYLTLKKPKQALKAFKMVLLLNPNSTIARRAVLKLESLTADEYDEEMFSMTKLSPAKDWQQEQSVAPIKLVETAPVTSTAPANGVMQRALERMLSLIDAFIVRNDLPRAYTLLQESLREFGDLPEIQKRFVLVTGRPYQNESAQPIQPLRPRHEVVREKKQALLDFIMRRVDAYRESHLPL